MRFPPLVVTATTFAALRRSASGFGPTVRRNIVSKDNGGLFAYKGQAEILDGVHLPSSMPAILLPTSDESVDFWYKKEEIVATTEEVQGFVTNPTTQQLAFSLIGKEKDSPESNDTFKKLQEHFVNEIVFKPKSRWSSYLNRRRLPRDYMFFGNNDCEQILSMFCKENPFFASALTAEYGTDGTPYFALNTFIPPGETLPESKFLNLMKEDPNLNHKINVRFNADMSLNSITKLNADGKTEAVAEADWGLYAAGATYNLFHYASSIHATLHILHMLLSTGITYCTRHDDALFAWAAPYDDNVANKYNQVGNLLIASDFSTDDTQLLTGRAGLCLGQTPDEVKSQFRDWLCTMGGVKTSEEFMNDFLLKDLYAGCKNKINFGALCDKGSILSDFRKQVELVSSFAEELASALKENDVRAFDFCEASLSDFMKETGDGVSSIESIDSWVQLMSCTGLVHTSTMSMSRLMAVPEFLSWRNLDVDKWDQGDISILISILGTICGATADRHVFTSKIEHGKEWDMKDVPNNVKSVLRKYDKKRSRLATETMRATSWRSDYFKEYGWILTDWYPELVDGKQKTLTTYI